jgi:hypothetical protein
MFNLMWGYLLIITILFSANIGLFLGNIKLNNKNASLIFIVLGIFYFVVITISTFFSFNLLTYFSYIFISIAVLIFINLAVYLKNNNPKNPIIVTVILFYLSSFLLTSQINESFIFDSLLFTLISIIIMIIAFQSSKLLKFAKRPYNVIVGEYMSLEGILIFLFGLTFISTITLDYTMFSSFLILTPTYQLIYVIIGIIFVLIIGFYWHDR